MFSCFTQWLCQSVQKFVYLWLALIFFSCLLSSFFLVDLRLDTNIIRLLPEKSPVSQWVRELRGPVGDGGYFTILVKSSDRNTLIKAADFIHKQTDNLPDVSFSIYQKPYEFIEKYKYLLLSLPALERLYDYAVRLESETNPFSTDLMAEEDVATDRIERNRQRNLEKSLDRFSSQTEFHESADGTLIGILIYPKSMVTDLEAIRKLYNRLEYISQETAQKFNIWSEVGGSQIKNLREYKSIIEDLGRAGIISLSAIFFILLFCFRSLRIIPVVVLPLLTGLAWAFAFVPSFVGPLNIITVFLLLILFGMGIDYSIHLIRHFQMRLQTLKVAEALYETFSTTGKSVLISGLTTALPLLILALSKFRGFSDFGIIGGWSILMMLTAMFTVLPPLLLVAHRLHLITPGATLSGSILPPRRKIAVAALSIIVILSTFAIGSGDLFDYNFSAHSSDAQNAKNFDRQHKKVFNRSMVPAALYLAPDVSTLDRSRTVLTNAMEKDGSTIERLTSVRDFAPDEEEFGKRVELILQAKEIFQGSWYRRITDAKVKQWVENFRLWQPPDKPATLGTLPQEILSYYMARDGSGQFLLGIYPAVSRRNGHDVLAFYSELEHLSLPDTLQGPIGEVVVFAEILDLVLHEAPIVIFFALLSVSLPIYLSSRSLRETALTLFPLISGMLLLFGVMGISGMQLNYLSIVIIPALLGMGVDDGIHYFRHCKAHGYNVVATQGELFGTLSVCTLTTMIGYFGLVVAHNRGLRSLGILACLGMACLWITSVFLLPAFLEKRDKRRR